MIAWLRRLFAPPAPAPLPHVVIERAADPILPAPPRLITHDLMRTLGWAAPGEWAEALHIACVAYRIDTPRRVAAFLAQVGTESMGGRYTREIWGPTAQQLTYEGRAGLGNTQPGEGFLFRGRGLIQITGRANTLQARAALRPGMELDVFLGWLESRDGAAVSAAWWWKQRGLNEMADADQFEAITRRVNGGLNGYADRGARWNAARKALGIG
jgi:putative chitinase